MGVVIYWWLGNWWYPRTCSFSLHAHKYSSRPLYKEKLFLIIIIIVAACLITEPVRLPDIPVVVKKKNTTWTIQEVDEKSRRSPTADDDTALKMLKEKKQANRTEYRLDFCQLDRCWTRYLVAFLRLRWCPVVASSLIGFCPQ